MDEERRSEQGHGATFADVQAASYSGQAGDHPACSDLKAAPQSGARAMPHLRQTADDPLRTR
jgi:hypothetical protein